MGKLRTETVFVKLADYVVGPAHLQELAGKIRSACLSLGGDFDWRSGLTAFGGARFQDPEEALLTFQVIQSRPCLIISITGPEAFVKKLFQLIMSKIKKDVGTSSVQSLDHPDGTAG